ncbi:hypothetical protein NDU88_001005 [Pleurodeles waltl]|uniref:Uncharacterized protein n=1 Tax=Pleurodeles waltl TaxID=8319 RepID=A0AAV7KNG0_PLEWA|nr:hypothetical protein NDU88_001003 [Pleurodeles waltl]KAJ1080816.1 hypothetical protein NDU88_001005 [Pleurodeles waltl]
MEIIYEDQQRGRVRPGRRVGNEWRLGIQRKGDLSGESEEGRPRGESGIDGGWVVGGRETSAESHEWMEAGELEEGDLGRESGMGGGWGVGGRETSAESQEWVEAGEPEEGRPQRRVRNGWRLGSRRKGVLSGESEKGRPRGESGIDGGWGVGGRETSAESQELVEAGESEEWRQRRVRNG